MRCLAALVLLSAINASAFDLFVTTNGNALRWRDEDLRNPLAYQVEQSCPQSVRVAMKSATQAWSDATGGLIRFQEVYDHPQIYVKIGPISPLYAAVTGWKIDPWPDTIVYSYITINTTTPTDRLGVEPVLLHELGHTLGLMHADQNRNGIVGRYCDCDKPIMWSTAATSFSLHLDDIIGIRTLYGIETDSIKRTVSGLYVTQHGRRIKVESKTESDPVIFTWGDGIQNGGSSGPYRHRYLLRGHYDCIAECRGRETDFSFQIGRIKRK